MLCFDFLWGEYVFAITFVFRYNVFFARAQANKTGPRRNHSTSRWNWQIMHLCTWLWGGFAVKLGNFGGILFRSMRKHWGIREASVGCFSRELVVHACVRQAFWRQNKYRIASWRWGALRGWVSTNNSSCLWRSKLVLWGLLSNLNPWEVKCVEIWNFLYAFCELELD